MTGKLKYSLLSKPGIEDEIQPSYRAMRYDALVWSDWIKYDETSLENLHQLIGDETINPGIYALSRLNEQLILQGYPNVRLEINFLEECMNEYQLFIQESGSPVDFIQSSKFAIVLIEKRKISENWNVVLTELTSRFRGISSSEFVRKWQTALGITINIIDTPEDLFASLCQSVGGEYLSQLFVPCLEMLGLPEKERLAVAIDTVNKLNIQDQLSILRTLIEIGEQKFSTTLARELMKSLEGIDLSSKEMETYWDRPVETFSSIPFNQSVAMISHIAGNVEFERKILAKTDEIIKAAQVGNDILKSGTLKPDIKLAADLQDENLSPIYETAGQNNQQLSFLDNEESAPITERQKTVNQEANPTIDSFLFGNIEFDLDSINQAYQEDTEGFIRGLFEKKPRFNPTWQVSDAIKKMIEIGAVEPAEKALVQLLSENPSNPSAIESAISLQKMKGKKEDWINLLEEKIYCGKASLEEFRELIDCEISLGRNDVAFGIAEQLLKKSGVSKSDRIQFANLALQVGKNEIAKQEIDKILSEQEDDVDAICLRAKISIVEKKLDQATADLQKAADISNENGEPWILLSEIQTQKGDLFQAIDTLKKGLISLPGNHDIKATLAEKLLSTDMTADALPLLLDLHTNSTDVKTDRMLLKAMKRLNYKELDDFITECYESHPDDPDVSFDYADLLLRYGNIKEAAKILKGIFTQEKAAPEWVVDYVDATSGLDPRFSKNAKQLLDSELDENLGLVNSLIQNARESDVKVLSLKAELLIQKGLVEEANDLLTNILVSPNELPKNWLTRIQTWFAWTSAALGKMDIALATIHDVVDDNPSLLGAQQVMAEILAFSDDSQEALAQAQLVVELSPDLAENILWAAEFFSNNGEVEKAIQLLSDGAKIAPEEIEYELALTKLRIKQDLPEEENKLIESIKAKVPSITNLKTLQSVSELFEISGDSNVIEKTLEERFIANPEVQNALIFAGFEYRQNDYDKAYEIITKAGEIYPTSQILAYAKADTLVQMGKYSEAIELLESSLNEETPREIIDSYGFVPQNWLRYKTNSRSSDELLARIQFSLGNLAECKQLSTNILEHEPENLQARIIKFEANKAGNFQADGDQFDFESFSKSEDQLYPVVVSEILEKMLDEQKFDDCWNLFNSLEENNKNNPLIKSIEANLVFIEGNIAEADEIFSTNTIGLVEKAGSEKLLRMISTRLAIKTAVRLSRWEEALKWAKLLAEQYPWNRDLSELYLSTLIQALEFAGTAETLQITKHSPVRPLGEIDADKELDWLRANLALNENAERLYIRGKLAINPDQEMVKAYAHFKPTGKDASVLIRALSKIGHEKTAEQIGKKYQEDTAVLFQNALLKLEDKPEDAFDFANKLIGLNANNPIGLALRSLINQKNSKNEQAAADIESALNLWPDEVNWHKIASDLWTTLGNDQKAIQHLEFMNEKDPNDVGTGLRLAKAYFARKDYDSSVNLLNTISQIDPNKFEVWEGLTDAQLAKGLVNEALDSAEKASEVNPFSIKPYLLRAQIDLDNGLVDKAYEQVKLADQKVSDNAEVKVFLAKVLFARGEKTAALQELENATHSENLTPMIILSEIRLIKEINGTASARNLIEYFAKKMPENAELLSLLAESQLENGDSHAAEVTARRVLKLKPDSIEMLNFMGKQQLKKGQLDQAIHSFSQVINLDSKNIEAFSDLGAAYQQQREISKAVEVFKQIIDIDPFETSAYISLANLYKDSKNYKLAEEMLKKAAEMEPKNVSIKRQLGALLALNLVHQSQEVSSQL